VNEFYSWNRGKAIAIVGKGRKATALEERVVLPDKK